MANAVLRQVSANGNPPPHIVVEPGDTARMVEVKITDSTGDTNKITVILPSHPANHPPPPAPGDDDCQHDNNSSNDDGDEPDDRDDRRPPPPKPRRRQDFRSATINKHGVCEGRRWRVGKGDTPRWRRHVGICFVGGVWDVFNIFLQWV